MIMCDKMGFTVDDAIDTLEKNRPTSGYSMLNIALDMSIAALEKQKKILDMIDTFSDEEKMRYYRTDASGVLGILRELMMVVE